MSRFNVSFDIELPLEKLGTSEKKMLRVLNFYSYVVATDDDKSKPFINHDPLSNQPR